MLERQRRKQLIETLAKTNFSSAQRKEPSGQNRTIKTLRQFYQQTLWDGPSTSSKSTYQSLSGEALAAALETSTQEINENDHPSLKNGIDVYDLRQQKDMLGIPIAHQHYPYLIRLLRLSEAAITLGGNEAQISRDIDIYLTLMSSSDIPHHSQKKYLQQFTAHLVNQIAGADNIRNGTKPSLEETLNRLNIEDSHLTRDEGFKPFITIGRDAQGTETAILNLPLPMSEITINELQSIITANSEEKPAWFNALSEHEKNYYTTKINTAIEQNDFSSLSSIPTKQRNTIGIANFWDTTQAFLNPESHQIIAETTHTASGIFSPIDIDPNLAAIDLMTGDDTNHTERLRITEANILSFIETKHPQIEQAFQDHWGPYFKKIATGKPPIMIHTLLSPHYIRTRLDPTNDDQRMVREIHQAALTIRDSNPNLPPLYTTNSPVNGLRKFMSSNTGLHSTVNDKHHTTHYVETGQTYIALISDFLLDLRGIDGSDLHFLTTTNEPEFMAGVRNILDKVRNQSDEPLQDAQKNDLNLALTALLQMRTLTDSKSINGNVQLSRAALGHIICDHLHILHWAGCKSTKVRTQLYYNECLAELAARAGIQNFPSLSNTSLVNGAIRASINAPGAYGMKINGVFFKWFSKKSFKKRWAAMGERYAGLDRPLHWEKTPWTTVLTAIKNFFKSLGWQLRNAFNFLLGKPSDANRPLTGNPETDLQILSHRCDEQLTANRKKSNSFYNGSTNQTLTLISRSTSSSDKDEDEEVASAADEEQASAADGSEENTPLSIEYRSESAIFAGLEQNNPIVKKIRDCITNKKPFVLNAQSTEKQSTGIQLKFITERFSHELMNGSLSIIFGFPENHTPTEDDKASYNEFNQIIKPYRIPAMIAQTARKPVSDRVLKQPKEELLTTLKRYPLGLINVTGVSNDDWVTNNNEVFKAMNITIQGKRNQLSKGQSVTFTLNQLGSTPEVKRTVLERILDKKQKDPNKYTWIQVESHKGFATSDTEPLDQLIKAINRTNDGPHNQSDDGAGPYLQA